jgi:hypothetical protein
LQDLGEGRLPVGGGGWQRLPALEIVAAARRGLESAGCDQLGAVTFGRGERDEPGDRGRCW